MDEFVWPLLHEVCEIPEIHEQPTAWAVSGILLLSYDQLPCEALTAYVTMNANHNTQLKSLSQASSALSRWLSSEVIPIIRSTTVIKQSCDADFVQLHLADGSDVRIMPLSGDAGLRRYYRMHIDRCQFIVMDSSQDLTQLAPFLEVSNRLLRAGITVPEVIAADRQQGFLVLSDFGDILLKHLLSPAGLEQPLASSQVQQIASLIARGDSLFTMLMPLFSALIQVDTRNLVSYTADHLQRELDLLTEWFLPSQGFQMTTEQQGEWRTLCECLINSALEQPSVFVHRDFHACNILYLDDVKAFAEQPASDHTSLKSLGVLDFQDAVCGPLNYDLASWLWDRYVAWPRERIEHWSELARQQIAPSWERIDWMRSVDWMGLQRNLKILGIFTRLSERDGKRGYLVLRPQFATYCLDVLSRYPELNANATWLVGVLEAFCSADTVGDNGPLCRQ